MKLSGTSVFGWTRWPQPAAICLAFGAVACIQIGPQSDEGGDDGSQAAPFAGTWLYQESLFDCVRILILGKRAGHNAYEIDRLCSLDAGGAGVQVETGDYAVTAEGDVTFSPTQATCAGVDEREGTFELIDADHLRLQQGQDFEVFERSGPQPIAPGVALGCFDSNGGFEARPLSDV